MPTREMIAALALLALAPVQADSLAAGFRNPPASARPHTWWHWMDGNVTREGITADLEAMKDAGIGGAQMFTVAQGIPKGPVDYMSPLWREMTKHAIQEAGRLGIELCLHNCAGWSSSGGPWVKSEHGMQVIGWSETKVNGPRLVDIQLDPVKAPHLYATVNYSRDIVVYAIPTKADAPRGADFLGKTGVHRQDNLRPATAPAEGIFVSDPSTFIDLTSKVDLDGRLRWDAPLGEWTILRIGHVPTGKNNHPAPPEGDGLEVDKLSKEALDAFWEGSMTKVIADAGPLAGKVLNNALVDSYEVGGQNWTTKMREEFQRRRGYDPMPYLPAICGKTVVSTEITERFLWDYRRTIADLFADNYFGYFAEKSRKAGLLFSTEPYGNGGFDNIQVGGTADIPMGEFWIGGGTLETTKLAASVGHVYGRKVIGAESFTADDVRGRYLEEPYAAKALGDFVFCNGINRYIFHRYAHQPWMNLKPGMTMGPWGTHLERTQTWWSEAKEWLRYVARCQYMLQSGQFVADVLYYYGEDAPVDLPYGPNLKPAMPKGYDYDGIDASLLMKARVNQKRIVLPSGMSYGVLVLPNNPLITLPVAKKIQELVRAGATVYGQAWSGTPGLAGFPEDDREVQVIARSLWGIHGRPGSGPRTGQMVTSQAVGQGRMVWEGGLDTALTLAGIAPDFRVRSLSGGSRLAWIHRRLGNDDVYFVSNQNYRPTSAEVTFRVTGKAVQLWHADTGLIEDAPIYRALNGGTGVTLNLGPAESVFVVFRPGKPKPHLHMFETAVERKYKPPVVVIQKARYETADGRGADVTTVVSGHVKEGNLEVPATNSMFGDPVVNVVKRLVVEYTLNGKPLKKTVAENEVMALAELPGASAEPAGFELRSNGAGLEMIAWKTGSYRGLNSKGQILGVSAREVPAPLDLSRGWTVKFAPNLGAPASIGMDRLASWSEHKDPGVKYFSGSATYSREFTIRMTRNPWVLPTRLELGRVKNFATVRLNGKELAVLWKEPFTVDVTNAVRPGKNTLEIKVTNLWVNRLIGDEQLPADVEWTGVTLRDWPAWLKNGAERPKTGRVAFTTWKFWNKDSPLLESGLLGPVVLRTGRPIPIKP